MNNDDYDLQDFKHTYKNNACRYYRPISFNDEKLEQTMNSFLIAIISVICDTYI